MRLASHTFMWNSQLSDAMEPLSEVERRSRRH